MARKEDEPMTVGELAERSGVSREFTAVAGEAAHWAVSAATASCRRGRSGLRFVDLV